jgi:murein DD-endopeptidase MepM/ murein hydrolase activator NlpD
VPVLALRLGAAALVAILGALPGAAPRVEPAWSWPVPAPHLVVRPYLAPATPYGAGHRGVDLEAPVGTPVTAPDDGTVLFAGRVVDRGVLSLDHGTVRSSFEPVRPVVHVGEHVTRGQVVAVVSAPGATHPAGVLHLGARVRDGYVSPLLFLGGLRRAVLLPLTAPP